MRKLTMGEIRQVMLRGAAWAVEEGYGMAEDLEVTEENGCLRMIAGSQLLGPMPHSDVWMVGDSLGPPPDYTEHPLIQHRVGATWTAFEGKPGEPWGVAALSAGDVWVVGNQESPSGDYAAMIEHWDGTAWSFAPSVQSVGAGDSELNDVTALPNGIVWAVGSYSPHGDDQPLIELNPAG